LIASHSARAHSLTVTFKVKSMTSTSTNPGCQNWGVLLHRAFSWCILLLHMYDQHIKKVSACSHSVHLGVMPKFLIHGQNRLHGQRSTPCPHSNMVYVPFFTCLEICINHTFPCSKLM
jgi:hypothetical protein